MSDKQMNISNNTASDTDFQADQAWETMLKLLDAQMPENITQKHPKFSLSSVIVPIIAAACTLATLTITVLNFDKNKKNHDRMSVTTTKKMNSNYLTVRDLNDKENTQANVTTNNLQAQKQTTETQQNNTGIANNQTLTQPESKHENFYDTAKIYSSNICKADTINQAEDKTSSSINQTKNTNNNYTLLINESRNEESKADYSKLKTDENDKSEKDFKKTKLRKKLTVPDDVHFGIGWNMYIPVNNSPYYWYDISGKENKWISLIPTIWISKTWHKTTQLTFEYDPYKLSNGRTSTNSKSATNIHLIKLRSMQLNVKLSYRFYENLSASAGLDWGFANGALVEKKEFLTGTVNAGDSIHNTLISIHKSDSLMSIFNPNILDFKAGLDYQFKSGNIGAEIRLPLRNSSSQKLLQVEPFSADIYIRLKIR
jgi:hypothetical protein